MTNKQTDSLRDIAMGSPIEKNERSDSFGQSFVDKSEQWLKDNKSLTPETKLDQWLLYNSNWSFTPNNRKYYWETKENLSFESPKQFQEDTIVGIREDLQSKKTLEDKENYFRDKAHTFPDYVHKDLEDYFFNLRSINDRKNLEKTRLTQILEVDKLNNTMKNKLKLAPDVSLETHTQEYLKAYDMGFNSISTDPNGRISIPINGIETAVYTLEDPVLSLEEEFISLNDLTSRIRNTLDPILKESRAEVKQSEKLANQTLLNRVSDDSIPEEFKVNIIIDGVMEDKNPVDKTGAIVNEILTKEIKNNRLQTPSEVSRRYFNLYLDIYSKLEKRIQDGIS